MITVTVCVGSSCHVKGAREMIGRFNNFLTNHNFQDKVELKGAFCMDHCGKGINWKINEEIITSPVWKMETRCFEKESWKLWRKM